MIAEKLNFDGYNYTYSHAKHNVLIYICQPEHYYEDWLEDGSVLVVEYRPDKNPNEAYYVLHQITVREGSGRISPTDLSNKTDRMAKPVPSKN